LVSSGERGKRITASEGGAPTNESSVKSEFAASFFRPPWYSRGRRLNTLNVLGSLSKSRYLAHAWSFGGSTTVISNWVKHFNEQHGAKPPS
jgi:hypothetical protein